MNIKVLPVSPLLGEANFSSVAGKNQRGGLRSFVFFIFLIVISPFAVSLYPSSSPPANPSSPAAGGNFGAAVTQNTQSALQIFTGVNAASFLKNDASDFAGFEGPGSSGQEKFSVDLADQPLEQSALDTQIEGDWNEY